MLIGGVAVIARGVRRLTADVDATLRGEGVALETLLRQLSTVRIQPRIGDALRFARKNQVLLLRHEPSGIDVDLSLASLPFESEALDRSERLVVGKRRVPVATAGDLVVYKAIAARERDRSDIERLLELHGPDMDLAAVVRSVEEIADALERPELVIELERLIRKTGAAKRASRAKPSSPRRARRSRR